MRIAKNDTIMDLIQKSGIPFVFIGQNPLYPHFSIDVNNEEGAYLVTKEIIDEITGGDNRLSPSAFAAFLSSAFIEDDKLENEMEKEYFIPSVKELNPSEYTENPYYKNIKIQKIKIYLGSFLKSVTHSLTNRVVKTLKFCRAGKAKPLTARVLLAFAFPSVYCGNIRRNLR